MTLLITAAAAAGVFVIAYSAGTWVVRAYNRGKAIVDRK